MSKILHFLPICLVVPGLLVSTGCSRKAETAESQETMAVPAKPAQAAAQLQTVFASSPPEAHDNAAIAAQAIQTADYEKAVVSLQVIKDQGNLTFEQGMAVHNSMVSLEARLITAMGSGDPNAKRAYDLLKKSKRQ